MDNTAALNWLQRRSNNSENSKPAHRFTFKPSQSSSENPKPCLDLQEDSSKKGAMEKLSKFAFKPSQETEPSFKPSFRPQQKTITEKLSKFAFKPSQSQTSPKNELFFKPQEKPKPINEFFKPDDKSRLKVSLSPESSANVGPIVRTFSEGDNALKPLHREVKKAKFGLPGISKARPSPNSFTGLRISEPAKADCDQPSKRRREEKRKLTVDPQDLDQGFRTAHEQLIIDERLSGRKYNSSSSSSSPNANGPTLSYGQVKKSLGVPRANNGFKPPIPQALKNPDGEEEKVKDEKPVDERLKGIDENMIELVRNEIMDNGVPVKWDDIAGLNFVKTTVKEIVVFPLLRPDIFCGLRSPPKGILLFGPPGTGKTLIGKCIASQSKSTFFAISASSLTSKWVGEGEKMVRALFAVARVHQPSVVFIDEIDSLLSQRSDSEHESSRRIKTEFLVQLDGASTVGEERILVVGATNRPQDLDEAARRRLVKRLYVPLPDLPARRQIICNLLSDKTSHVLTDEQLNEVSEKTDGYSGADMANLCKEAAMGPIRDIDYSKIDEINVNDVRPINYNDFLNSLTIVKASVSNKDLELYAEWDSKFGCGK